MAEAVPLRKGHVRLLTIICELHSVQHLGDPVSRLPELRGKMLLVVTITSYHKLKGIE